MPGATLPPPFAHPEDVARNWRWRAIIKRKLFGAPPAGWPSEGSVARS